MVRVQDRGPGKCPRVEGAPVVVRPAENEVLTVGKEMTVKIDYPGDHQFVSMSLSNQENVSLAVETLDVRLPLARE